jgi:CrcB protein
MPSFLLVFLGAGLGGALRHGVNIVAAALFGVGFPVGTLFINIAGSFAMGLLTEWFALKFDPGQHVRLFVTTGLIGGFTTFSTFSLETVLLVERGTARTAAAYVLLSVVLSIGALVAGLWLVRRLG